MGKISIGKWNYETREYDPYTPPKGTIILFTQDIELPINCTSCGKDMTYGEGYTSRELHTNSGLGFPVCEDCYEDERRRETQATKDKS